MAIVQLLHSRHLVRRKICWVILLQHWQHIIVSFRSDRRAPKKNSDWLVSWIGKGRRHFKQSLPRTQPSPNISGLSSHKHTNFGFLPCSLSFFFLYFFCFCCVTVHLCLYACFCTFCLNFLLPSTKRQLATLYHLDWRRVVVAVAAVDASKQAIGNWSASEFLFSLKYFSCQSF